MGAGQNQDLITIPNAEKLEMYFDDLAMHGDTAVIYYNTHRTVLPNGENVDQRYHITHVWTRDTDGDWKLLGAMGRLESE
jgi:ketosteroid isomerase-like protein